MEWRPINTAPKDGSWILAFDPDEDGGLIRVVHWSDALWTKEGEDWVTDALGPCPDVMELTGATHWMPLPLPPTK